MLKGPATILNNSQSGETRHWRWWLQSLSTCMVSVLGTEEVTSKHVIGKLGAVLTSGSQNTL